MNLKYYRLSKRVSIPELSRKSSVPIRTIEDIEKRGSCKIDTAKKLAEALNINLYDLVGDQVYEGKYDHLDLCYVLSNVTNYIADKNDLKQLILDLNTYEHGIHIQAMNKIYQIFEDIESGKITDKSVHWEKTLPIH